MQALSGLQSEQQPLSQHHDFENPSIKNYLKGDIPALPLPLGPVPRLFNKEANSETETSLHSPKIEPALFHINHTDSRLKIRNDLMQEWKSIVSLQTQAHPFNQSMKSNDQQTRIRTNTTRSLESIAELKPSLFIAPFNAQPSDLFEIGKKYELGKNVDKDILRAMTWFQRLADQGYTRGNLSLGFIYYLGKDYKQNFNQAIFHFQKAAEKGDAKASYNLAKIYHKGKGVEINLEKAADWYRKAALKGQAIAQFTLGYFYHIGRGVNQDLALAMYWYEKAAAQDYAPAQNNLGKLLGQIDKEHKNYTQSTLLYLKAAEKGLKPAQHRIAIRYAEGKGVDQDLNKAIYWALRYILSTDGKNITIPVDKHLEFITFIPNILNNYSEFRNLQILEFTKFSAEVNKQMGSVIAEVIQNTSSLTCVKAAGYKINVAEAKILMQALASNTTVTELILNFEDIDLANRRATKKRITSTKALNLYGPENSMKHRMLAMTQQNQAIQELRIYLKKYLQELPVQPKLEFDVLPSEIIVDLADRIIVTNLKKGNSKQATLDILNEFLLSAQKNSLTIRS